MFSKSKTTPDSESAPSLPAAVPAKMATGARHTTFSILGSDVVITGNVAASVDLHVDGKIDGDLKCANLVQGEASEIKGAVIADTAKIGDPHVAMGLVAGDGGAVIWPQLVGVQKAKEYLLTGEPIDGATAAAIGLVNHYVPAGELDARVDAFCDRLAAGASRAIQWTKIAINLELKRIAHAAMDAGMAYESLSTRTADHAEAAAAFLAKRSPRFTGR